MEEQATRKGRRRGKRDPSKQIFMRLPAPLVDTLTAEAGRRKVFLTDLLRIALAEWAATEGSIGAIVDPPRDMRLRMVTQGKYDGLGAHLAADGAAAITLTFAAVEGIVGALPRNARGDATWWGLKSGRYHHMHVQAWRDAGYVADRPDFAAETVTFRRVAP